MALDALGLTLQGGLGVRCHECIDFGGHDVANMLAYHRLAVDLVPAAQGGIGKAETVVGIDRGNQHRKVICDGLEAILALHQRLLGQFALSNVTQNQIDAELFGGAAAPDGELYGN